DNGLDGGLGDDLADYAAATDHGITANLETGTADNGSGGMDTLSRIEHLMGTPFTDIMVGNLETNRLRDAGGDDFIFGGGGGDVIQGDAGNDQLGGGDGDDTIAGNEGDDFLFGDAGNDFLTGGDGFDTLDGGAGIDSCIGEMEMNC
ncbi:MAG: hypothetical protein HY335_10105, partial [Deinococcus sp.]|nr:hypothetical protein [Deinococcus sp.]